MLDKIIITPDLKFSLEVARRDIDFFTKAPIDYKNPAHHSEYAFALTMFGYKLGQEVSEEQFQRDLIKNSTFCMLDDYANRGLLKFGWDDKGPIIIKTPDFDKKFDAGQL